MTWTAAAMPEPQLHRTLAPAEFRAALAARGLEPATPVLVAVGGWGVTGHDRVGLLALGAGAPEVVADAYLPSDAVDELVAQLARARPGALVRRGGWDTMYLTGWTFAWTEDDGPFEVWDGAGRLLWLAGDQIHARGAAGPVARAAAVAVEPYVQPGWVFRGVRLRLQDGATFTVAEDEDHWPEVDFTYDGLMLMADVSWTHGLARALGRNLGLPVVDCTG